MNKLGMSMLSAALLLTAAIWVLPVPSLAATGRGAGIPPDVLPKALMGLDIKDYFIPSEFKGAGVIQASRGHVVVVHKATRQAYFAMEGDRIFVNDDVHTLTQSRCRIRLLSGDVISMAPESNFSVETYEDRRGEGKKTTLLGMLTGKVKFYALRLLRYKETRFAVRTPTAVVGVRGTKFGIHAYWENEQNNASRPILLADRGGGLETFLAKDDTGEAGKSHLVVHAMEGDVDVDGKEVPEDHSYKDGVVDESNFDEVEDFDRDTDIEGEPSPEEGDVGEPIDPLDNEGDAGDEAQDDQTGEADVRERLADIQVEENSDDVIGGGGSSGGGGSAGPPGTMGYFSAMLSDQANSLVDIYSSVSMADLSGSVTIPLVPDNPPNGLTVNALAYLQRIVLGGGDYDSGDLADTRPISKTVMGSNAYLEWGYWTMPILVDGTYLVDNRAYSLIGNPTPDATVNGLAGAVNYTGTAWGTYYSDTGGDNMSGNFSCTVDFTADTVSNFNMTLDNGGAAADFRKARIDAGAGTLVGGQFSLNPAVGTYELQAGAAAGPIGADQKACAGALYGPAAEAVGGVWGMKTNAGDAAVGGFQGAK